jgi:hypothetical protein
MCVSQFIEQSWSTACLEQEFGKSHCEHARSLGGVELKGGDNVQSSFEFP